MKQRTRLMQNGDDFASSVNMGNAKNEDADENSEIQLHMMKPQEHFIEAQVQEGDTLQAIALRFYCSISELKRINHIHKDNEIFARRTIKVPITPYSVLTELIPTNINEPVPSTSSQTLHTSQELIHNSNRSAKTEQREDCAVDCNEIVLNSTLAPAVLPYTDTTESVEQASEDTQLLPNKEKESVETIVVKQLTSQGADFGLKWFHLLCFVLVLGVVAPLIYVMFFLDKHDVDYPDLPPLHTT